MSDPDKHSSHGEEPLYALSAEFVTQDAVLAAAEALRPRGFGRVEIYSPVPIPGAPQAIGRDPKPIPHLMATGAAILGFLAMMGMCVYATAIDYRFDIGGRPLVSWPAFIVPSVSFAMLCSAVVVFFNMTYLNRLPLLNHPSFNIPGFLRATQDRFFVTVEPPLGRADAFDPEAIERALAALAAKPVAIMRVPR